MKELKNIWRLLRTGNVKKTKRSSKQMVFFILKMLLFFVIFNFMSIGLIFLLDFYNVLELPIHLPTRRYSDFTDIELLLIAAVHAPILEELTFRLPLKFSKLNVVIASIGFTLIFSLVFTDMEYFHSALLSISIGIILYIFLKQRTLLVDLSSWWLKNKKLIFYSLLLIFSFGHLNNYPITTELLLFSPIIILPKFLSGLLLSYIRLNSGILLAICFHSFQNGLPTIVVDYLL